MKSILIHKSHVLGVHETAFAGLQVMCEKCMICSCLPSGQKVLMEVCAKANEEIVKGAESLLKDSTFEPVKAGYADTDSMHEKKESDMPTIYILNNITEAYVMFNGVTDSYESIRMSRDRWKALGRPETLFAEFKDGEK